MINNEEVKEDFRDWLYTVKLPEFDPITVDHIEWAWQARQPEIDVKDKEIVRLTHQVESLMNLCRSKNESIIDITAQRDAEIERLREALRYIRVYDCCDGYGGGGSCSTLDLINAEAIKALEGGSDE